MNAPGRDSARAAVYAAEDQLGALLDRGGPVEFHGSLLDLPRQRKFADLDSVERYLAAVREHSWGHPGTPVPRVRRRRGQTRAHWQSPDEIALPTGTGWALTELVVLHEYTHHVLWHEQQLADHGPEFCHLMHQLVSDAVAPTAGLVLLAAYDGSGALPQRPKGR